MIRHDQLYVNGVWVDPAGSDYVSVVNPETNEIVGEVVRGIDTDVDAAVSAARAAFRTWSVSSIQERIGLLKCLVEMLYENQHELAQLVSTEMGAPLHSALADQVVTPISMVENTISVLSTPVPRERIGNSLIVREAVGVVGAITPWNYPLYQLVAKAIPAIAAGCTVVVKPPELAPLSTFRFTELMASAGFPPGVFNLVSGRGAVVGEALAAHPGVDMISFTGSTEAGSRVAQVAARSIKRVALELGGKSASVILPGADLKQAVEASVEYCMANTGQSCSAWTRLIVAREDLAQAEMIASATAKRLQSSLGPLISEQQYSLVQEYIAVGSSEGARIIHGGLGNPEGASANHPRVTVFSDVTPQMRIAQEEIFGPVMVILSYSDLDEAVEIANSTPFGLHGAVWAATDEEALAVAHRMRTGQVDINGGDFNVAAPFGGYKQSGIGRELGPIGLEEFTEVKSIQLPG